MLTWKSERGWFCIVSWSQVIPKPFYRYPPPTICGIKLGSLTAALLALEKCSQTFIAQMYYQNWSSYACQASMYKRNWGRIVGNFMSIGSVQSTTWWQKWDTGGNGSVDNKVMMMAMYQTMPQEQFWVSVINSVLRAFQTGIQIGDKSGEYHSACNWRYGLVDEEKKTTK